MCQDDASKNSLPPVNHPAHQSPISSRAWLQPGILFAVLAMASLSFSDATSKWVMLSISPVMVLWFRYAVQAVGTTLVLAPLRGRAMWRIILYFKRSGVGHCTRRRSNETNSAQPAR